ncbi:MAG: beta-propeller fold lactonase family protein [Micrococcales bacterium]|nr:beta-propeller fold lactonase family protein [Micrococcales bacterium]
MTAFLVGGYTADAGGTATGIGLARTRADGLEFLGTVAVADSPSWLLVRGDRVYAVGEGDATVSSWRRSGTELTRESSVAAGGEGPCHLALDGDALLVSCYGGGVLTRVPLREDGSLAGDGVVLLRGSGGGPHPDQRSGHLHASAVRRDGRAVALDLGSDTVHLLDGSRRPEAAIAVPAGTGPRDLQLLPDGRMLVLGELSGTLLLLSAEGELLGEAAIPGAEPGDHAAALGVVPLEGGFRVVTGLRGTDRIAVLDVPAAGTIAATASIASGGVWPRYLLVDGDRLHVAHERSSQLTTLRLHADGTVQGAGSSPCPSPTHLVPVADAWADLRLLTD